MIRSPFVFLSIFVLTSCGSMVRETEAIAVSAYADDLAFLRKYGTVTELSDSSGKARVAIMPALQGRVMTSTDGGVRSFGWINRELFLSGDTSIHMNAFGGEERFWLGPEGGQFSIFFGKGKEFTLTNWQTPRLIDLEPFEQTSSEKNQATFEKHARITNYSGTVFDIAITRTIRVLESDEVFAELSIAPDTSLSVVAYQSSNTIQNKGSMPWKPETGLLSIWLLGMFNPSPSMTVVIPYTTGPEETLGPIVIDDYFGKVPPERLKVSDGAIFFSGDGQLRSKIGLSPARAKNVLGSYDEGNRILTIVKYNKPSSDLPYVNSKWEIQKDPFRGDVINSYNDGPPAPGAKPLGPFYELETSSPAAALAPSETLTHIQTTFHFSGEIASLDRIAGKILGVSLEEINNAF